jgi:hypothetical protein
MGIDGTGKCTIFPNERFGSWAIKGARKPVALSIVALHLLEGRKLLSIFYALSHDAHTQILDSANWHV